jgi:hypothetical protein
MLPAMSATSPAETYSRRFLSYDPIGMLRRRLVASIAATAAWISALLLYVAFAAPAYSLFQNAIVVVVSLVLYFGALAGLWVSFGLRMAGRWAD